MPESAAGKTSPENQTPPEAASMGFSDAGAPDRLAGPASSATPR